MAAHELCPLRSGSKCKGRTQRLLRGALQISLLTMSAWKVRPAKVPARSVIFRDLS